ncbi:MAG TPA: Bax inhibitor-1 family protein [Mucilaginibacter sp.]|jgi:hypothetical protein|nr:Bax inhibitor-1 family protein [Mucilaginibacter sp.]
MKSQVHSAEGSSLSDHARGFMVRVFMLMFAGLAITSACIYVFDTYDYCMDLLVTRDHITILFWLSLFGPFLVSLVIRRGINYISYFGLCVLFLIYAALIGICFSFIFSILDVTDSSLFAIFITACLAFGAMGIAGFTTLIDPTQARPIIYFLGGGLIAVIPIVFLFPGPDMSLGVSFVGVLVFMGIGAMHFGDLRDTADQPGFDDGTGKRMAVLYSLYLYADFVNLFFFLAAFLFKRK